MRRAGASPPDQPPGSPGSPARQPARPPGLPAPAGTPNLTWFRLHASTTVIDFPLHASPGAQTWVATLWPDPRAPYGWVRQPWQPGPAGRGFVPVTVELGDIIQFGVQHPSPAGPNGGQGSPVMTYWHGYLHAVRADAVLLHGPHPSPDEAYAAAQHALLTQIHQAESPGYPASHPARPGGAASGSAPVTPAQPPATTSVAFHGQQATVGDPVHGWLVVPTERLLAAMPHPTGELAQLLTPHVPHLTGREPLLTLAALAAHHLPNQLPTPTAAGPTGPTRPGPAPSAKPPQPPTPPPPASPTPQASL